MNAQAEHPRAGITDQVVERYAAHAGACEGIAAWAVNQARNALADGVQADEAILIAINEIDACLHMARQPHVEIERFVRDAGMEAN